MRPGIFICKLFRNKNLNLVYIKLKDVKKSQSLNANELVFPSFHLYYILRIILYFPSL